MTRTTSLSASALLALAGVGAPAQTASAQDNVWIAAGAGLWIEFGFPLNFVFDDIHWTAVGVGRHFRNQLIADVNGWLDDNIGVTIEAHLEANAGIDVGGAEINVGKAGAWIGGCPPIDTGRVAGAPGGFCPNLAALVDLNGDGFHEIPLFELPGDVDAMVTANYYYDQAIVEFFIVEPAPRVDESDPNMEVFIPMPGDPGFNFTPLGAIPIPLLNDLAQPLPFSMMHAIPQDAFFPGSPELHEIAAIDFSDAQPCPGDFAPPFGVLDFNDVVGFLTAFSNGDPAADLAPPFGVLDFNDVIQFLSVFGKGCP